MTGIKMSDFTATKSDRLNAEDLMSGPIRVRVTGVKSHPMREDGPVSINYEDENGKPYMPCKSMRRVLLRAWGDETDAYIGRELVLFRNPEVSFGKDKTGGVRISHMSHIGNGIKVVLQVSKGRMGEYAVAGLKDAAPTQHPTTPAAATPDTPPIDRIAAYCATVLDAISAAETVADLEAIEAKAATKLANHKDQLAGIRTAAEFKRVFLRGDDEATRGRLSELAAGDGFEGGEA